MAAYIGHLSTTAGDGPEVVIKLVGLDVVVTTPDERRHVWPVGRVRVTGVASPRFRIAFDDEDAVFTAHHPSRFLFEFVPALQRARAAAAQMAHGSPDPVQPIAEQPPATVPTPEPQPSAIAEPAGPPPVLEQPAQAPAPPATEADAARGSHWVTPEDSGAGSRLLRETHDAPAVPPLVHVEDHDEPVDLDPQPLTAYRPRRRWFRRNRPCEHDWQPRVIGGYRGRICTVCFEVSLTRETAAPGDEQIIVDLTDGALGAVASDAQPDVGSRDDR